VPSVPPTVFQGLRAPSKLGSCTGWLAQAGAAGEDELAEFPVLEAAVELTDEVDAVEELYATIPTCCLLYRCSTVTSLLL